MVRLPYRAPRPVRGSPPRVAVVGSLCSSDLVLADALRRHAVAADVLRPVSEVDLSDLSQGLFPAVDRSAVTFFREPRELLLALRRFDVVFSFTAAIGFHLDRLMYLYPYLRRVGWPPYINVSTGSDITERALHEDRPGMLQRFVMRHAFAQSVPPYPDAIRTAARMRLGNACSLPPVQITLPEVPVSDEFPFRRSDEDLVLLHPSNLDWGLADPGPRSSTKGNDRFFRALAMVRSDLGRPLHVIALDRGPDRQNARALVTELDLDDIVEWRAPLSRPELFAAIRQADVVVDQFDVGALGMIAWEAMSVGKPVLAFVDTNSERLAYDVSSPVLNAHSVEEIAARICDAADRGTLADHADRARTWARERAMDKLLPRYLFYASLASGRAAADFGWDRPFGHERVLA